MAEIDNNTIAIGKELLCVVSCVYTLVCYSGNGALRERDKQDRRETVRKVQRAKSNKEIRKREQGGSGKGDIVLSDRLTGR